MALTHGVNASKKKTSVSTPIKVASGVHFAVGAAPVQMVGGKTNEVIMANDYEEAVRFLGYSDDWEKYPLCMEIYTAFTLYNVAPVIMVNVLDPKKHKKKVEAELEPLENQILLPLEALADTVAVKDMERDTDYTVFYTDNNCAIEFLNDTKEKQNVTYDAVDPTLVTVIVAAISSKVGVKPKLPTHYFINAENGLELPSIILLEQLRTIDKQRLTKYIGRLDQGHIRGMNHALAVSIGLIEPIPSKLTLCLCSACADAFRSTGAFLLNQAEQKQAEKEICAYCKQEAGVHYDVLPKIGRVSK